MRVIDCYGNILLFNKRQVSTNFSKTRLYNNKGGSLMRENNELTQFSIYKINIEKVEETKNEE